MKNMETIKQINANGKMSNLIGMWAFIWHDDTLVNRLFIYGKADDQHYIVQGINAMTGETNVCKIVELKDMLSWTFYPSKEIAEQCYQDYINYKKNRFEIKFGIKELVV